MKVLFMGTPDFAIPCLKSLIKSEHNVCGVFTQPDKPKGRGHKVSSPPIKELAVQNEIEVFQPKILKDDETFSIIKKLNPEIIIVVAYGKILPKNIIDYPKYGCINVHASLLPKYRGAAPIQWCVINGEKRTGVTTMYMDVGLDTGDMLLKSETVISDDETSGELHDKLSLIGAELLIETLEKIKNNTIERKKQNDAESSYSPMINKSLCNIDWNKKADEVHNLIRGLNPWPTASTLLNGKVLKIHKTKVSDVKGTDPGKVVSISPLIVSCADNTAIEVLEVQMEGKKKMCADEFLRGHKININEMLGD